MAVGLEEEIPAGTNDFLDGVLKRNPVFVQVLGMCPTLAVTNTGENALAMGLATAFVLLCSNIAVSMLRKIVPPQVRIVTFILVIATFVTIVDYLIQAISLDLHKGARCLHLTDCCELLDSRTCRSICIEERHPSFDARCIGMGLGFLIGLLCLGVVREIMGSGSLFGVRIFGESYQEWTIMMLPPGGFFTLGGWLLFFNWISQRRAAKAELEGASK